MEITLNVKKFFADFLEALFLDRTSPGVNIERAKKVMEAIPDDLMVNVEATLAEKARMNNNKSAPPAVDKERRSKLKVRLQKELDTLRRQNSWFDTKQRQDDLLDILSILSAPAQAKPKVSRERVKHWIPCTCDVAYTSRGLTAYDCPFHGYTGWEDLLNELGYEVEEEKP